MVGDGGLRECYVVLHVAGAHAHAFSNGALAFLLQQPKYFYAGRIGHCFERRHELFIGHCDHILASFLSVHSKIDFGQYAIVY